MSSVPQPQPQRHPLFVAQGPDAIVGYRRETPVSARQFLHDVMRVAEAMPSARHVLNFCADRYRFTVVLCAAIARGQMTLLPPTTTANVIAAMRSFAPDVYYVTDDEANAVDLPRCALPAETPARAGEAFEVPCVDSEQAVACVFTSGSTGEPQPHRKRWGALVVDIHEEATRLGVGPGHTILGTVPPQHMFGFESTVLLPLMSGAALTSDRLYYPADIDAALRRAPAPRTMFTTPFHLRAWIESGETAQLETIVSATAPLSPRLAREAEEATGATVLEIYGCTEAGQVATRRTSVSPEWHAFDGLKLWLQGEQAMVGGGHVERPTPLMDVIEVLGDGTRFLLHGRTADLVNIAGKRNSIGYLDHQLLAIPGVVDGAFFMPDEKDEDGVTRLMAFVVAPTLAPAQVVAALRARIDPAFLPRPVVMLERLPRQLTGKLPREQLVALARAARGA